MAIVVGIGVRRRYAGGSATSIVPRLRHVAGLCTVISSFTFLFAVVIGLIA